MSDQDETITPQQNPSEDIQPQTYDWPKPNTSDDNLVIRGNNSEPLTTKIVERE